VQTGRSLWLLGVALDVGRPYSPAQISSKTKSCSLGTALFSTFFFRLIQIKTPHPRALQASIWGAPFLMTLRNPKSGYHSVTFGTLLVGVPPCSFSRGVSSLIVVVA